jgi:small-conductance mechanosensitive channel
MVTIGDKTGVVIDKNLLVTRLRTPQNEEVSIPNGNVLSSSVLNYSARAASDGLALTVKAGIGYDVGWRTVHELMIQGARATAYILAEPAPEVWQSELSDYAVNYELRAFTNRADLMWSTLSLLRQSVLDAFNRAGVEIMTPSIFAHRDASHLAVPLEEFPQPSRARSDRDRR